MNDHFIAGSKIYNVGFVDSGTTFSYFPTGLMYMVKVHFDWFCNADDYNCMGKRLKDS
jgi:hypothetical protein